jgi:hypothetical protein
MEIAKRGWQEMFIVHGHHAKTLDMGRLLWLLGLCECGERVDLR